ncbi:TetR/AcrR family transcriptional regulator [Paenibacillus oenotherae]|uniref:TetR/AcrR family transcriptional regulator n=1 Tax=Paenibacillus oenotherae TaxID=1435645 RepID=A0ABS7DA14_9BACL|nr:TetR/AcrR family transcriptional regulator [Paenibacillus oenotherae]MBW7476700.1 TetR/AcrR family transcriptional regulator [Paenibacillus oenotherae]
MIKNKFQLKREATYRQLLEAGMKCFSAKGFSSTTIGDIVAQTGHTNGAFYVHFKTKEQIFLQVLDYQMQITSGWTDVPKAYSPADTTLEEVVAITLARLDEMLQGVDNWIVVLADFYQHTRENPEIQSLLREKYRDWVSGIEQFIRVLQLQGWIPKEKDTLLTAKQVIAFNEGFTVFSKLFGETDMKAHIQGLVRLMS